MQSRRSLSQAISSLRAHLGGLFSDSETAHFLKARNARLTVQVIGSQSYYVVKVTPQTNVSVPGDTLRFKIQVLPDALVRVTVDSKAKKRRLVDLTVPNNPSGGALNLNLDDIHLKMDIDDDPSLHAIR